MVIRYVVTNLQQQQPSQIVASILAKVNRSKPSSPVPQASDNFMIPPLPPSPIRQFSVDLQDQENARLEKFGKLLSGPTTDLGMVLILSTDY